MYENGGVGEDVRPAGISLIETSFPDRYPYFPQGYPYGAVGVNMGPSTAREYEQFAIGLPGFGRGAFIGSPIRAAGQVPTERKMAQASDVAVVRAQGWNIDVLRSRGISCAQWSSWSDSQRLAFLGTVTGTGSSAYASLVPVAQGLSTMCFADRLFAGVYIAPRPSGYVAGTTGTTGTTGTASDPSQTERERITEDYLDRGAQAIGATRDVILAVINGNNANERARLASQLEEYRIDHGLESSSDSNSQNNNAALLALIASLRQPPPTAPTTDSGTQTNTLMYVGIGVAAVAALGAAFYFFSRPRRNPVVYRPRRRFIPQRELDRRGHRRGRRLGSGR